MEINFTMLWSQITTLKFVTLLNLVSIFFPMYLHACSMSSNQTTTQIKKNYKEVKNLELWSFSDN